MDGEISDDRIASARSLYDDALYIQAARALEEFGHPRDWKGAGARIFGARLSQNLGAHRQAVRLFAAAYRSGDPGAESMLYRAYQLMAQRGPLAAWSFLRDLAPPGQPEISASIYALRGKICAHFKDRRGMAAQFGLAFASAPDSAWIHTEHSSALELIDELAAAQSEARKALALQCRFRPAVQQLAHLLLSANEDAEALALLEDAASRMESGAILQQWIIALSERGENLRIPALCERAGQLLIWADAGTKSWLSARRADAFRGAGDFARAAAEAARCPDRLYQQSLSRLVQSDAPKARIKLDVPFIRQDDNTCAPASLASIMAYWQKDVTHEQIAEAVCYGGTVSHGLRKWVEDFGWFVREFRVTWESTCALTDRGMPFLLATSDIGGGHMQVIEGYDAVWNAILIRDPNFRHHRRVPADEFLANYRAFGPRGILILPPEEAARGRDLPLACSRDFDRLHRLNLALEANDRKAAGEEFSGLADEAAEPFLLYAARLSLAGYDGNALETLQCLKAMEEDGLDHPLITWIRLDAEKDWGDPRARLDRLRSMAERPDADPAFLALYAMELSADETTYGKALGLFRRYHSLRPRDAASLSFFGRQAWMRGDRENGRDLIRFAATCADTVEEYALEYFQAAGASGQESEALEVLKERAAAAAGKSSLPSRTLYTAYRSLGDDEEAFAALSRARDSRPDDGVLMLFCAYEYASAGQRGAAADLLRQAEGRAKETLLLRTSACLAALDGDADGADSLWRRVAELEPLALDAHFHLARATAAKDGAAACVAYWNSCCERLPFHTGFSEQRAIAALALGEEFAEPYVRDWLALLPGAVVPGCELIRLILARAAHAEALAEAERLSAVAPYSSRTAYWLGRALEESGASARAQESYERALVLDPDNAEAFQRFWFLADGAGRTRIFDWLGQQILQTPSAGGAISAWFDIAAVRLPFQEVQEKLDQIRERHRTCWPAWHCAIENLLRFHFPEKAGELAREAIAQFPLVPAVHAEAAAAFERAGSTEEAEAALQRAIVLNPSDPDLWARQAWLHDRTGNPDEGVRVLNEGIRRNPGEAALRAVLAGLLWKKNLQDEAFVQMHHALARNPGMDWAWDRFCEWCIAQSRHGHFAEFIRSVAATRPGDIGLLTMQARGLLRCGMPGEADAVIDRILILQPRNIDAHLLRTEILVGRGRFEEALDLCVGERWRDNPPALLRGQAAAVEAASKRLQRAIERIQDVVEKEPGYVWAWERLAEWSLAKREFSLARTAAVRVTELIPQRGQAWHNLAMIENTAGNEKEAVRCLREAVRREPSYEPAVLLLMEWLIFSDADDEAAQLFASASAGLSKSLALVYEIMAALKHKRRAEAEAGLSKLLMMPGVNTALLANLWEGAAKLRGRSLLDQTLDAAIWLPEIQPAAAVWWTERKIASENFAIADSLVSLSHDSGARKAAISHFLQRLRELNRGPAATDLFNRHAAKLRSDDTLWALIGCCLLQASPERAREWMSDWKSRTSAEPWMLQNVAAASLSQNDLTEAFAISQHAAESGKSDSSHAFHQLVLALRDILNGGGEGAEARLEDLSSARLGGWESSFRRVIDAVLAVQRATDREVREVWKSRMRDLRTANLIADPTIAQLLSETLRRLNRPGVSFRVAPPSEKERRWRRPSGKWLLGSYAASGASIVAFVIAAFIGVKTGGTGDMFGIAILGGVCIAGAINIFGLGCAAMAYRRSKRISFELILSGVGNLVFPAIVLVLLGSMVHFSLTRPGAPIIAPVPPKYYAHPAGIFTMDFAGLSGIVVNPAIPTSESPNEGVMIHYGDQTGASVVTRPRWVNLDSSATAEEYADREIRNLASDPTVFLKTKYTDSNGRIWLRMASPDRVGTTQANVIIARDITVLNEHMLALEYLVPLDRFASPQDAEPLVIEKLNFWHDRLKIAPERKSSFQNAPPVAEAPKSSPDVSESPGVPPNSGGDLVQGTLPRLPAGENYSSAESADAAALADAELATEREPDNALAWTHLGNLLMRKNEMQKAGGPLAKSVALDPTDPRAWYLLGYRNASLRDWLPAIEALRKSIRLDPNATPSWESLSYCYRQLGDSFGEEQTLRQLLTEFPDVTTGWFQLGCIQADSGMPSSALRAFDTALKLDANHANTWNAKGLSHAQLSDATSAMEAFRKAIAVEPTHTEAWNNLGYALFEAGNDAEAVQAFQTALRQEPNHTRALINLTNTYLRMNDAAGAEETCRALEAINPQLASELRGKIPAN